MTNTFGVLNFTAVVYQFGYPWAYAVGYIATLRFMYPMDYFVSYFPLLFLHYYSTTETYTNIYLYNFKEFWHHILYHISF